MSTNTNQPVGFVLFDSRRNFHLGQNNFTLKYESKVHVITIRYPTMFFKQQINMFKVLSVRVLSILEEMVIINILSPT